MLLELQRDSYRFIRDDLHYVSWTQGIVTACLHNPANARCRTHAPYLNWSSQMHSDNATGESMHSTHYLTCAL